MARAPSGLLSAPPAMKRGRYGCRSIIYFDGNQSGHSFIRVMRTGKAFVALKMAQSRNGKIGIRGGPRVLISGSQFNEYSQTLRNRYDAILAGINTVLADDPRLTCRMPGGRDPVRIIVDSRLSIPLTAKVLKNAKKGKVIVATSAKRDRNKENILERLGATVLICGKGEVDMELMLSMLPKIGIISVLVEGGAKIEQEFIRLRAADKAIVCVSRMKITSSDAVASPFTPHMLAKLKGVEKCRMGRDTVIEGYFRS